MPFITAPFNYPDIDHKSIHGVKRLACAVAAEANHPIRQALEWQKLIQADSALNQAKLAAREGISRARVTQIMQLLGLPTEIRNVLLEIHEAASVRFLNERRMRAIAGLPDRDGQLRAFRELRQNMLASLSA